jgi:hypothetical protein
VTPDAARYGGMCYGGKHYGETCYGETCYGVATNRSVRNCTTRLRAS